MAGEKNILLVTEGDLKAIEHWPIELRALFDPRADRELALRAAAAREERRDEEDDGEIPF
jgi:hypothetical protein